MSDSFFGMIEFQGEDAVEFLHNQFSNDLKNLAVNQSEFSSYSTPQGRVIANFLLLKVDAQRILMLVARDLVEKLIKRLTMFKLRAKVTIEDVSSKYNVLYKLKGTQKQVADFLADAGRVEIPQTPPLVFNTQKFDDKASWQIGLPYEESLIISSVDEDVIENDTCDLNTWMIYELLHGMPWVSQLSSESHVAQMLNLDLLGAVHFRKGCYPGQEVIARAHYRGKVKRGLAYGTVVKTDSLRIAINDAVQNKDNQEQGQILFALEDSQNNLIHLLMVIKHSAKDEQLIIEEQEIQTKQCFFIVEQTKESGE